VIGRFVQWVQGLVGAATIDEIIYDRLLPNEKIFMVDGPATIALVVRKFRWIVALAISLILMIELSGTLWKVAMFVLVIAISVVLLASAVQFHYTRYVVTGTRMIYLSGVFNRSHQWIPWGQVTDMSYVQGWTERIQNIGRVRIESANEASPFREMTDLSHPGTMMRVLVYMVSVRQGEVKTPEDLHAELGIAGLDGIYRPPAPRDDDDGSGGNGGAAGGDDGDGGGGDGDDPVGVDPDDPNRADPDEGDQDDGDLTAVLAAPYEPGNRAGGGSLPAGSATVPGPTGDGEARPSRANPVRDVSGSGPNRRPEPPRNASSVKGGRRNSGRGSGDGESALWD
jgi:membrane protein YdbS with pleckstrin-like domain